MAAPDSTPHATPTAEDERAGALALVMSWGPLWFGLGFLAPLIAQSLDALALQAPLFPSNLAFGLVVGGGAGFVARLRGTWL